MAEELTEARLAALEKLSQQPKSLLSWEQLLNVLQHEAPLLIAEVRRLRRRIDLENEGVPGPTPESVDELRRAALASANDWAERFGLLAQVLHEQLEKHKLRALKQLADDQARFGGGT